MARGNQGFRHYREKNGINRNQGSLTRSPQNQMIMEAITKYTVEQIENMNYAEMREIRHLSQLPEVYQERIIAKLHADANLRINTAVEIRFTTEDGRKEFYAKRHSDRRTGSSVWSVSYTRKGWGVKKQVIGYDFDVFPVSIGRLADGTNVPSRLPYKKDVLELMKHIYWCKDEIA